MEKSIECCYLQIINSKKNNSVEGNKITNVINYCKLRNFSEYNYEYSGNIVLNGDEPTKVDQLIKDIPVYTLHYYFSNKKSYISVDCSINSEYYIPFIQYKLLKFTEKFFGLYNIDTFLANYNKEN